jgi:hypothetical protein
MAQYLVQEHLNSEGEPDKPEKTRVIHKRRPRKKKAKLDTDHAHDSDSSNDSHFTSGSSDSSSSDNGSAAGLTNAEVSGTHFIYVLSILIIFNQLAGVLPTKSVLQTGRLSQKRKRHGCSAVVMEEVEDQDSPRQLSARSQSPLDANVILDEEPEVTLEATSSAGGANKKARKVSVIIFIRKYRYRLLALACN